LRGLGIGVLVFLILFIADECVAQDAKNTDAADYPYRPVPFTDVTVTDAFWAPRIETNRNITIPYAFEQCEKTGRIDNFAIAGNLMEGEHKGSFPFDDTDPYKILEGAAYTLAESPDQALETYLDELIAKIAAAQEDDGYIYTCRTNECRHLSRWMGPERWVRLSGSHELYNAGHLYEAAAAHFQATGKRSLLDVALRNADLLCRTFHAEGLRMPPGHQIIEMGLARLFRITGDPRLIELARYLLLERGRPHDRELWGPYNQDHAPVIEQREAVGHAVRATYMYAGMADVAALTGDEAMKKAIDTLWRNVVEKKLYVTGGVGARGNGEAFGDNYELPNMSAYCETCAAIGNVYWNHRLFLLHGEAEYIDVLERTLYNAFLSGIALDGKHFFYPNPLESMGQHRRSPWFGCACCPGNVTRFIASVPGYLYAHRGNAIHVNLFASGKTRIATEKGAVRIEQETRYPWGGHVRLRVDPEATGDEFTLFVRIPGWARNRPVPSDLYRFMQERTEPVVLEVNGESSPLVLERGFARINRAWQKGDVIDLELPMPVRRVAAHPAVEADRGKTALQRGPLVYCAEWPDNDGHVIDCVLPDDAELYTRFRGDLLGGITVIEGECQSLSEGSEPGELIVRPKKITAIPYHLWAHRGPGEMAVWLARERGAARPLRRPTLASTCRLTESGGKNPGAMNDRLEPESSGDHGVPFFHWWPRKGTVEWVECDFGSEQEVSRAAVYWFDDTGRGECLVPASWRLLYRDEGEWKPVSNPTPFDVALDQFNEVTFDSVTTDGIRLEVELQEKWSAGIHELVVSEGTSSSESSKKGGDTSSSNALANPSFEKVRNNKPEGWSIFRWGGKGKLGHAPKGRTGSWSASITSRDGADIAWGQRAAVRPFSRYRLSGWIRTEGLEATTGRGALFNLHALSGCETRALLGTNDWTLVEMEFDTEDIDMVHVNCLFGGWGFARGKAWYDDVRLELLETRNMKPEITISKGREGTPISKYIYGQFIEHLGRCIYGGIWAEMLEDRKFFLPVDHKESPWRSLGPEGAVSISREDPYVGEHTPEIETRDGGEPAGIVQEGLGLEKGKAYLGRIVLAGKVGAGTVDVSLVWGPGDGDRQTITIPDLRGEFRKSPLRFEAGATTDNGRIEITVSSQGIVRVGTLSLMPADNVKGMRRDTLALLEELDSPIYRWPGGNFVSGYDWRDGIGDPDRRPPRKNPAWTGVEHNDFGIHEFMDFCTLLGTEPYVTVNTGEGTKELAADEVEYFNGAPDTPMGKQRAANGRREPWGVTWWAVGNEMYGNWQIGHMPLETYVKKHNAIVDAMRARDSSIRCVAVGNLGRWTEVTLAECCDHMELISEHFYVQELPGVMGHSAQAPRAVKRICDAHRRYKVAIPALENRSIPIALDEWNYWYGPHLFGELGTRYFWKDGLGIARALHEYFRNSDIVFMANYAQTVNVIGCIKTSKTAAAFATTGQVLKLYRRVYGEIPIAISGTPEPLDVAAAWTSDRSAVTLAVVNPLTESISLPITWEGIELEGKVSAYRIRHDDPMAYNEPGRPDEVFIEEFAMDRFPESVEIPSLSVTVFRIGR